MMLLFGRAYSLMKVKAATVSRSLLLRNQGYQAKPEVTLERFEGKM